MIPTFAPWLLLFLSLLSFFFFLLWRQKAQFVRLQHILQVALQDRQAALEAHMLSAFSQQHHQIQTCFLSFSQQSSHLQQQNTHLLQATMRDNVSALDQRLHLFLQQEIAQLVQQFDKLNTATLHHLLKIQETVHVKLSQGFEKTQETFTVITERLTLIDEAQKKMAALSNEVVNLQQLLTDKQARGALGEVQLTLLIQNVLPSHCYQLQHTFSNGTRVDCLLYLPKPTGNIAIDAKFPLENFKKSVDHQASEKLRQQARNQFKADVRKHIQDVQQKYILPGETSEGAILFIPAEAIFAEIHSHSDLIEYAWQNRVWLVSPSTLMAILTTASSVLKETARNQQIHVIQKHLRFLAKDFERFEKRMQHLSQHLRQANQDAEEVHLSSQKITKRFQQIEKADLPALEKEEIE